MFWSMLSILLGVVGAIGSAGLAVWALNEYYPGKIRNTILASTMVAFLAMLVLIAWGTDLASQYELAACR